jgi:hypothetical protein
MFNIIVGQVLFKEKKKNYIKDEGSNLNTMTKSIVNCESLGLE